MINTLLLVTLFLFQLVNAQDSLPKKDSSSFSIRGYIDAYYGLHSDPTSTKRVPYFVTSNANNQININVAFIELAYTSKRVRAKLTPGFGSYFNENYSNETATFKHLMEAWAGVKLFKQKDIWLDAGILPSPYTNETTISKDHICYTRALAGEYVPYYLMGAKLSVPVGKKWMLYAAYYNGWQQITDLNNKPAGGIQAEFRPNDKHLINLDAYAGDEQSVFNPSYRNRYFVDAYWLYNMNGKWSASACAYFGTQQMVQQSAFEKNWFQINAAVRYTTKQAWSFGLRSEYFSDENSVLLPNSNNGLATTALFSNTLSLGKAIQNNALVRLEGRQFIAPNKVFGTTQNSNSAYWVCLSLAVWLQK